MKETHAIANKAAELRQEFDRSFALPPPQAAAEMEDLLAVRVANERYAIRLRDIAAIVTARKLTSVPATTPDFLGVAGIRGGIVAVFGLASILGYVRTDTSDAARWMVLTGGAEEPVALGFSHFDGYLRIPKAALRSDETLRGTRKYVEAVASTDAGLCAVIGIPLVVTTIRNRAGKGRLAKGQSA